MQSARSESPRGRRVRITIFAIAIVAALLPPLAEAAAGPVSTLERVRYTGKLTLGYRADARPFSYRDESGNPAGYSVALCSRIAEEVKAELGLSALAVDWVAVTQEDRFRAVEQGRIDLLCGTEGATLTRRKTVGFSIPIFPAGIGAILRADAPAGLQDVLMGRHDTRPRWRASPAEILERQTFSVVAGTTTERWLAGRLDGFKLAVKVVPEENYDAGIRSVLDRRTNVFFAERAILLEAAKRSGSAGELMVLERRFTYEPLALALARGDEDFRLLVDRTLSHLFGSKEFSDLYAKWFGSPNEDALRFFQLVALPQ
jgi:putrescine:ornithine antiporter